MREAHAVLGIERTRILLDIYHFLQKREEEETLLSRTNAEHFQQQPTSNVIVWHKTLGPAVI